MIITTNKLPVLLVALALCVFCLTALAQSTAFTYQGFLTEGGTSANGVYDLTFTLYNAYNGGSVLGMSNIVNDLAIINGLFTVTLDYGAEVFTGADRWLQIAVRAGGSVGPYTDLVPRYAINATPYAINAANLMSLANQPLDIKASGFRAFRLEGNATSPNVIGGYVGNSVVPGRAGAVISGGGANLFGTDYANVVDADFGSIGGGWGNMVKGNSSTIAGGFGNTISNSADATIAGGTRNTIRDGALRSAIGGGTLNVITNARFGTIPGGAQNEVAADFGFAAGNRAHASHTGTFIWADSTEADFVSTGQNQFLIRANGGVGIGINNPQAKLHVAGTVRATSFSGDGTALTGITSSPGGVAGGDLSGSYPNPVIANNSITTSKISSGQVVKSLNSLRDALSITAGANVTVTPVGNSLQISSTGGGTLSSVGIKSGTLAGPTSSQFLTANVAFGTPYPNASYSVSITPRRASASGNFIQPSATYTNKTAAGFTAVIFASSTSSITVTADWIAIPYNN
jgi:hypothetical protein